MYFTTTLLVVCQLLIHIAVSSEAVKIGISKPLPTITTTIPPSFTTENIIEEITTETFSTSASSTTKTTTVKATTIETAEWPEFPPKKNSKITTETPLLTTSETTTIATNNNSTFNETNVTNKTENSATVTSTPQWPITQKYCFCDLTTDSCDINCCCDRDCSPAAFKVFHCLYESHDDDLEMTGGRYENFKFQNILPTCEESDGWLCVFRTYKPDIEKEVSYNFEDTSQYYKWPNLLMESEDIENREFYRYGDLIKIINIETNEIQNLDLPSTYESSFCRIQEPIYHLQTFERFCLFSSYHDLTKSQLQLLELQEKYKIFKTPLAPDDIYNNNNEYGKNFLGNITFYNCYEMKQNCSRYNYDKEIEKHFELFKIKLNVLHNFTNIQELIVELWFKDQETMAQEYWLTYELDFFNKTSKEFFHEKYAVIKNVPIVSGPLGYLKGKPVIIARYEPFNQSQPLSTKNQILNYFSINDTTSHKLALLAKERGECKRSKSFGEYISYGINVATYCKIKLENETLLKQEPSNTNFTEICLNLQQHIYDQLFGEDLNIEELSSYFVSQLGKPQNNTLKWLQFQVSNSVFDAVVGQYLHETNTFVCRNILLSFSYEFHISNVVVDEIPLQNIINYAALHLAERHDLEFSLNENLEVPITMTARFFDHDEENTASAGYANSLKIFNSISFIILGLIFFK